MKECFIVTPIGDATSAIRREIDGLINTVFTPVLGEFGLTCIAAHSISESGSITRQVIQGLLESDLVIANLTNLNPNVMYELGVRHSTGKPTIVIARDDVILPFDLSDERTIFYKNDISGVNELKVSLRKMLPKALEEKRADNPVYRVVELDLIKMPDSAPDSEKLLNNRLSQLEYHLEDISRIIKNGVSLNGRNKINEKKESHFKYYLDEQSSMNFTAYCSLNGVETDEEMVYKDVFLISAYPKTMEQITWLDRYELENGLQRI
ncbi:hypothetical protein [Aliivibrio fischeri]|uniref:hypothetical protein n=1 Tax=Aliivibrio fischeri TaxID=668 RepID=UPI0012D9E9BB|nr:hypothetical protein [Aliivibrio fischeri]MUJ20608.1 hypothetical protein [Aliivibrio fischeri]